MNSPLDDARVRFIAELPEWDAHASAVQAALDGALSQAGIHVRSEARAKTVSSFVKKVLRKQYSDPWSQVGDKAGVRLTVSHIGALDSSVATIEQAAARAGATIIEVDDRREPEIQDVQRLEYLGVHIDLDWPVSADTGRFLSDPPANMRVEVQVRTEAQSLWATVSHPLVYKPTLDLPTPQRRSLYRLLALVELFDTEVERAMNTLLSDPRYPEARLLEQAEQAYHRFQSASYDRQLSLQVLRVLALTFADEDDQATFPSRLTSFVADNEDRLARVFSEYGADSDVGRQGLYLLLSQPESIVLLQRLAERATVTEQTWEQNLPEDLLADVRDAWGSPLPG